MKTGLGILWYDKLDSTNNEALRRIEDIDNMSVIAAVDQYAGRGQRGNTWKSEPGECLTFSIVLKFSQSPLLPLPAKDQFSISVASTLTVRDFLSSKGIEAKIKWPNDIYVGGKKICGMLVENSLSSGMVSSSIIGIGINLNQKSFPVELVNPTSMWLQTRERFDIRVCLEEICGIFEDRLTSLCSPEGRDAMMTEYLQHMYRLGEWHDYRNLGTGELVRGRIVGLSPIGELIVEDSIGKRNEFGFKEIGYII